MIRHLTLYMFQICLFIPLLAEDVMNENLCKTDNVENVSKTENVENTVKTGNIEEVLEVD